MKKIPFYANPDETHCWQCCLRMVLEYFKPKDVMSWDSWDDLTGKKEDLSSWELKGLSAMENRGLEVTYWVDFDYSRFIQEGADYLRERYGQVVSEEIIRNSDIPYETKIASSFLHIAPQPKVAQLDDVKQFLDSGHLVICNVNSNAMNQKPGVGMHFVLVHTIEDEKVVFHDPGPPACESREVHVDVFKDAWAISSERDQNLMAFKPLSL